MTRHNAETRRSPGPAPDYVECTDCGRTANNERQLEGRPCEDGFPTKP